MKHLDAFVGGPGGGGGGSGSMGTSWGANDEKNKKEQQQITSVTPAAVSWCMLMTVAQPTEGC